MIYTKSKSIYLAGPIAGCTDDQCKAWREQVKEQLGDKFVMFDPFKRDYRGRMGKDDIKEIVEQDKAEIREADLVLANVWQFSVGTIMEICYAYEQNKKVLTICPVNYNDLSPWLIYHSNYLVTSLDRAIELITNNLIEF